MDNIVTINKNALEPLYAAWEEPIAHRTRADGKGEAGIANNRRPSKIPIVNTLRRVVREWRETFYAGVSPTTRNLLEYWFQRSHRRTSPSGEEFEFRYYFCQREAIETLIYLREVRKIASLSQMVFEFGGDDRVLASLGITEEEDAIARYCFKLATGAGKTKCMSLAIVWSYFHALMESESDMARHFVIIAPNLTVYERLKEDFKPEGGGPDIFDNDPLIPPEWRGDWNMSIVLQSEASGAATGGVIYLTNIHQLYDTNKRSRGDAETYAFMGPPVARARALDTGQALRERITAHERVMVLNDEAHHVWDPESAWNEAIVYLNDTIRKRTGGGLVAQLDFTATPKDNKGNLFKHIVCDTPLGEAVDAGIVKTPILGSVGEIGVIASDNAAVKYEPHLLLGYRRWFISRDEWKKSGKKPLMFVMCEDTQAADEITQRLNTDAAFKDLNGKTINLHTNLKGKVKYRGKGADKVAYFEENDREISDEDLKQLRKLSRELDQNSSPYNCIVSVLMLREGWDVRNVTTIVPLRPFSSKANILPEQTLGRGLRRMTPPGPGQVNELVTVVDHPAFHNLYREELAQEGVEIEVVDVEKVPTITVSIFPDAAHKDIEALDITIPRLTAASRIVSKLENLTIEDVRKAFPPLKPLKVGEIGKSELEYEGRHMFTGEIVEQMKVHLLLLTTGVGAVSFYAKELEYICHVKNTHSILAPLLQTFFEEILFEKKISLYDPGIVSRLSDPDVREHVRAIFVPLIRKRTTTEEERLPEGEGIHLRNWKPYQVTSSETRPVLEANQTLFNLVPCHQGLEQTMAKFLDLANDVAAFAKNAGPQCLRIDYFTEGRRLAFYTPDFFVRGKDGRCYLVETKGRQDRDVPIKAKAAMAWCQAASSEAIPWEYVYVPQGIFQKFNKNAFGELVQTCAPALYGLTNEKELEEELPLFATLSDETTEQAPQAAGIVDEALIKSLPSRYQNAADQAIALYRFMESKKGMNFAPVFTPLLGSLDEAAKGLIVRLLSPDLPFAANKQRDWFDPYYGNVDVKTERHYQEMARNLKRTLIFNNGISPIGLLRNCLNFALNDDAEIEGVFESVRKRFSSNECGALLPEIETVNFIRNTYVAHQEKPMTDVTYVKEELKRWIEVLANISGLSKGK